MPHICEYRKINESFRMAKHSKHAVNALKEPQKVFPRALSTFQRRFCGTRCKNIQKEKRELGQLMLRYKFDGGTVQNTDRIKKSNLSNTPKTTLEHLQTFLALCSSPVSHVKTFQQILLARLH